jgi:hypothetical protein
MVEAAKKKGRKDNCIFMIWWKIHYGT